MHTAVILCRVPGKLPKTAEKEHMHREIKGGDQNKTKKPKPQTTKQKRRGKRKDSILNPREVLPK